MVILNLIFQILALKSNLIVSPIHPFSSCKLSMDIWRRISLGICLSKCLSTVEFFYQMHVIFNLRKLVNAADPQVIGTKPCWVGSRALGVNVVWLCVEVKDIILASSVSLWVSCPVMLAEKSESRTHTCFPQLDCPRKLSLAGFVTNMKWSSLIINSCAYLNPLSSL